MMRFSEGIRTDGVRGGTEDHLPNMMSEMSGHRKFTPFYQIALDDGKYSTATHLNSCYPQHPHFEGSVCVPAINTS